MSAQALHVYPSPGSSSGRNARTALTTVSSRVCDRCMVASVVDAHIQSGAAPEYTPDTQSSNALFDLNNWNFSTAWQTSTVPVNDGSISSDAIRDADQSSVQTPECFSSLQESQIREIGNYTSQEVQESDIYLQHLTQKYIHHGFGEKVLSLDEFRQAVLLTFYDYHDHPGQQSWARVGQLTRLAYRCGLDQIDSLDQCALFDDERPSPKVVEEWRYVWWLIYCFDSYCNIPSSTPFVVETESLQTALAGSVGMEAGDKPEFLPSDTAELWMTVKSCRARESTCNFNMHIITTAILKEAGKLTRLRRQRPSAQIRNRLAALDDHWSAVRLAMTPQFNSVQRDLLRGESMADHHARLACVLHLYCARILLRMPGAEDETDADWESKWYEVVQYCGKVVEVAKDWDASVVATVDPAVCFIISTVLCLTHVHTCCDPKPDQQILDTMDIYKTILELFLDRFASVWALARALLAAYKKFKTSIPDSIPPTKIRSVLLRLFKAFSGDWAAPNASTVGREDGMASDLDYDMLALWQTDDWDFWGSDLPTMPI
ncbi:hypothetical protein ANO11243_018080 [Dothideomycetidae sp. 11243]|nr:hypothetical protein ANO11243_018080 [fungal sp. No.11243]